MKVSDTQQYAIAKRAAQSGTTAAMRYFANKYRIFERTLCQEMEE